MNRKMAFVLSGGASRGALQVGALKALFETGYKPDILTGTSIGAANSAFLAVHGVNEAGLQKLVNAWQATVDKDLLPSNLWWQVMQVLFKPEAGFSQQKIREFAIRLGIDPGIQFNHIRDVSLRLVAADLNSGRPVIYGVDPTESVLEGMLASMTLPPWLAPLKKNGGLLVDGGVVSNLPVEAALQAGAGEIIALDLHTLTDVDTSPQGISSFLWKLNKTIESRQADLEIELAEANGVTVKHIHLVMDKPVPFYDFRHSLELMQRGYEITWEAIRGWEQNWLEMLPSKNCISV